MASQSGKVIILKDLSNLMKRDKGNTRNDLSTVVQMLNEKRGKIVGFLSCLNRSCCSAIIRG